VCKESVHALRRGRDGRKRTHEEVALQLVREVALAASGQADHGDDDLGLGVVGLLDCRTPVVPSARCAGLGTCAEPRARERDALVLPALMPKLTSLVPRSWPRSRWLIVPPLVVLLRSELVDELAVE